MNAGLRYEPWFPWEQEYGRYTSWEYRTQSTVKPDAPRGILFPGDPDVPDKTIEGDWNNFAPRIGVAWDVDGNGRTVIRGGYGIYYNHIAGTSVHAAEAPWTGTVQLFTGRIEDPFGSLNRTPPPSGVPISGDFGCVPISAYPGLNCPLYPLPLNFVYNDLEMATPYVHHANVSFQRQLTNDIVVDAAYIGRFGKKLEGHRHFNPAQFINSPLTGAAPSTQNINDRVLYEPGIIGPTSRVLETIYESWYHGARAEGHQANEPRVHVLGLLHTVEGGGHAARSGCRADRGGREPVRPDRDEGTFAVRSAARGRVVVDVGAERTVRQRCRQRSC